MRFIFALMALCGLAAPAAADDFNAIAIGCTPQEDAIGDARYTLSGGIGDEGYTGGIQHAGVNIDLITLYCPIANPISLPNYIRLLYSSAGDGPETYVSATLIKIAIQDGEATAIDTVTSDSGIEDGEVRSVEVPMSEAYNRDGYYYYLEINIDRDNIENTAVFYGITVH